MSAREDILTAIRQGRGEPLAEAGYTFPFSTGDAAALFVAKAKAGVAEVTEIGSAQDAPEAIWAILSRAGAAPRLHLPIDSGLRALPWSRAPGLTLSAAPPSGDDSAFAAADWAIAETGTLVFVSGSRRPSSWHFLPGREMVLLEQTSILPRLEDVLALAKKPVMPATINLVTGPSRTGDIEQTIELGAHGPREVHILIAG